MKLIFVILFGTLSIANLFAASEEKLLLSDLKYRTYFGKCPSSVAGKLTLTLMKEFEKTNSLKSVKKLIVKDKLEDKYFLSNYKIDFDPLERKLKFYLDCPKALMKVQIYKDNGDEYYTAILVDSGKLVDPTYEILLRTEKKLKKKLPSLALPVTALDNQAHLKITELVSNLDETISDRISEVIVNENSELTIIMSFRNRPTTAFLGKEYWGEKVKKLAKVIDYMKKKKSVPTIINLTNSKKIVVKFSDKI